MLKLVHHSLETGTPPRVKTAAHLMQKLCYENKDSLLAGVIIAGWDPVDGASVYNIPLGGTCLSQVPFACSGSGSTYIYGLIDSNIHQYDQAVASGGTAPSPAEARATLKQWLAHAMARDGSSGGVIRTVVVTPQGNDRDYTPGNALPFGPTGY
jgi:20S proteasome subunit beta 1